MLHALAVWFGLTNGSGRAYLFWSGIGSDLGELAILGGAWAVLRKHNCHVKGCWRVQRVPVPGGDGLITCWRHHPAHDGAPTAAHVNVLHRLHRERP